MSISFDLPASVEDQLRRELADLDVVAKEAALVELYRQERITHHQLGLSLGLERHETDGLLKRLDLNADDLALLDDLLGGLRVAPKIGRVHSIAECRAFLDLLIVVKESRGGLRSAPQAH